MEEASRETITDEAVNTRLDEIAVNYQIPKEEVKTRYNECLQTEIKEPKVERALDRTESTFKRALVGVKEVGVFQGLIVGVRELADIYENMRMKSKNMYDNAETRDQAIAEGYASIDGQPLDYRPKMFGTRTNPNFGKPLLGSQFQREMFAVVGRESTINEDGTPTEVTADVIAFQRIVATGKRAQNLVVPPLFVPVRFKASVQKKKLGIFGLTRFEELSTVWNIEETIKKAMPTFLVDEVEEQYLKVTPVEQRRREVICIEGKVLTLGLHGDNKYIDISTKVMKGYIRCFLRGSITSTIDFGEDSRVLVIGTPNYGRGGQGFVCSAYGIWAPEEDKYPPQE